MVTRQRTNKQTNKADKAGKQSYLDKIFGMAGLKRKPENGTDLLATASGKVVMEGRFDIERPGYVIGPAGKTSAESYYKIKRTLEKVFRENNCHAIFKA